jgi:hypothetical protein
MMVKTKQRFLAPPGEKKSALPNYYTLERRTFDVNYCKSMAYFGTLLQKVIIDKYRAKALNDISLARTYSLIKKK